MGKGRANEKDKGRAIEPALPTSPQEESPSAAQLQRKAAASTTLRGPTPLLVYTLMPRIMRAIHPRAIIVDEATRASDPEILSIFAWYRETVPPFDHNDDVVKQYLVHEAVLIYDESGHTRTTHNFQDLQACLLHMPIFQYYSYAEALGVLCEEVMKDLVMKGFANHPEPTPQEQDPRPSVRRSCDVWFIKDITQYWKNDGVAWLPSARQGSSTAFEFSVDMLGCLALLTQMGSLGSFNRLSEMTILMEKEVQRRWGNEAAFKEADILGTHAGCQAGGVECGSEKFHQGHSQR
ncbi:hypothetical protein IWZ01DRAFT_483583 [Phyllosticta capitalensis]